jgi:hypothetical protein
MVTSSKKASPSMQVRAGVKKTEKDEKSVSVGAMAVREGVESAELFPPQADTRNHR